MPWLFWALLSPFLFSITNFFDKFLIEKKIKDPIIITILSGILYLLFGTVVLLVKGFPHISFAQLILILLSGIFLEFYLIPYFKALSIDDTSQVVPLFQFVPVFSLVFAYIFLHEILTHNQFIGFIGILIGGFVLGAEKLEKGIIQPRKSFWYMMLSSLLYAIVGILFKFVSEHHDFLTTLAYQAVGAGVGAIALLSYRPYRKKIMQEIRKLTANVWGLLFIAHFVSNAAEYSSFFAFTLAPVALVAVIGGAQPIFLIIEGIILSLWFPHIVKENIQKSTLLVKLASIVIIIVGTYFIST